MIEEQRLGFLREREEQELESAYRNGTLPSRMATLDEF
jgi:hypothetical protein